MMAGRPKIWNSKEELQEQIDKYIESCYNAEGEQTRPFTLSGLAYWIGIDRRTLLNYKYDDEFCPTLKRYKDLCENYAEEQLFLGKNVAGVIFAMKNNYEWQDKQVSEHQGGISLFASEIEKKANKLDG
jgi:hypothetical protein